MIQTLSEQRGAQMDCGQKHCVRKKTEFIDIILLLTVSISTFRAGCPEV